MVIDRAVSRIVPIALSCLACALAASLLFWFLAAWYRYHPHMPWRDTLPLLRNLMPLINDGISGAALASLVEPHYTAHRVLIPRLLLLADIEFFGGRSHLLFASGALGLGLILFSFSSLAIRRLQSDFWSCLFAVSLCVALLFFPAHLWNFLNPICSSWPLSVGLSVAALYLLISRREQVDLSLLLMVYFLAALAAFSNFLGVLVWLLLPLPLIAGREKNWYLSVLASGFFVGLYLMGINTDAEIAISITEGHPDNVQMQSYASHVRDMVAHNDAGEIISKTVLSLGAPLSIGRPLLASALVALSFILPVAFFVGAILRWWRREERLSQWAELCLLGCALCIGAALSTHIGRVMPYPDVIHGASPERYQSYVVVYWVFCMGLLLDYAKSPQKSIGNCFPALALVVVAILGFAPRPDYLEQEIRSAEHAGILYSIGENNSLRVELPKTGLLYTPEYALAFQAFFSKRSIAYKAEPSPPPVSPMEPCGPLGLRVSLGASNQNFAALLKNRERLQLISLELDSWRAVFTRDIVVFTQGKPLARLFSVHRASYSPIDLLKPSATLWHGAYRGSPIASFSSLDLRINGLLGSGSSCRLELP